MLIVYSDAVSPLPFFVMHGRPPERPLPSAGEPTGTSGNRDQAFHGFQLSEALHLNLPDHSHFDEESL